MAVLEVNGLKKVYTTRFGGSRVQALTNVTFAVERGEYVAIMGESGSGKTTLLNILAALDRPTEGEVFLNGLHSRPSAKKRLLRSAARTSGLFSRISTCLIPSPCRIIFFCRSFWRASIFRRGRRSCCRSRSSSALQICSRSTRTRSPAARSSAPQWRVRSSPRRRFSLRMNPPAHSIPARPTAFYRSLARLTAPVRRF